MASTQLTPIVAILGKTPTIPAMRKYVLCRSKREEKVRVEIMLAALLSKITD